MHATFWLGLERALSVVVSRTKHQFVPTYSRIKQQLSIDVVIFWMGRLEAGGGTSGLFPVASRSSNISYGRQANLIFFSQSVYSGAIYVKNANHFLRKSQRKALR